MATEPTIARIWRARTRRADAVGVRTLCGVEFSRPKAA